MISRTGFALIGLLAATANAHAPDDPAQAVRLLLEAQQADWNRGDLDAFLGGYWNSPDVVFQSGGERFKGFETLKARFQKRYKSEGAAMGELTFSDIEIETLADNAALARGRWSLRMPDGKTPGGLFTVVVKKRPEGWRIVHDHTSSAAVP